jgi:hypothetical protein
MHRIARKLVPTLAILALVAGSGCADRDVATAPAPAAVPAFGQGGSPNLASVATFRQRPSVTIAWAKKWIGPEGGRLDFQGFAIVVPAGAVDRVTQFSISLPVDPQGSEHVVAEFGPHNQLFAQPVTIELPFRGTSIEGSTSPTIVWWSDQWVDMGASLTPDGLRLKTQTNHFSTYATSDVVTMRGGSITVSGG